MNDTGQLYLEDFTVGMRFDGPHRVVTQGDFEAFAALTGDAHPIHYDANYARRTRFGRPLAHGLLLMAWSALGATALSRRLEMAMVAFIEQGCRFTAPVFVGDGVMPEFSVESIDVREGRDSGRIRFAVRLLKDDGTVCFSGFHLYALARRPRAQGAAA